MPWGHSLGLTLHDCEEDFVLYYCQQRGQCRQLKDHSFTLHDDSEQYTNVHLEKAMGSYTAQFKMLLLGARTVLKELHNLN